MKVKRGVMHRSIQEHFACCKSQYGVSYYYHRLSVSSLILCCLQVFEDGTDERLVLFSGGGSKKLGANIYSSGLKGFESPDISHIWKDVCKSWKVNTKNLFPSLWA